MNLKFSCNLDCPYSVQPPVPARTKICPINDDHVLFPAKNSKHIELPVRPIIGTIEVAPRVEKIATVWHGQEQCGNIDSPDVAPGNKDHVRVTGTRESQIPYTAFIADEKKEAQGETRTKDSTTLVHLLQVNASASTTSSSGACLDEREKEARLA